MLVNGQRAAWQTEAFWQTVLSKKVTWLHILGSDFFKGGGIEKLADKQNSHLQQKPYAMLWQQAAATAEQDHETYPF